MVFCAVIKNESTSETLAAEGLGGVVEILSEVLEGPVNILDIDVEKLLLSDLVADVLRLDMMFSNTKSI